MLLGAGLASLPRRGGKEFVCVLGCGMGLVIDDHLEWQGPWEIREIA
jgi:hypothetical protein